MLNCGVYTWPENHNYRLNEHVVFSIRHRGNIETAIRTFKWVQSD